MLLQILITDEPTTVHANVCFRLTRLTLLSMYYTGVDGKYFLHILRSIIRPGQVNLQCIVSIHKYIITDNICPVMRDNISPRKDIWKQ